MSGFSSVWGFISESGPQGLPGAPGPIGPTGPAGAGTLAGMSVGQVVVATQVDAATSTPKAFITQDGLGITYAAGGNNGALDVFDSNGTTRIFSVQDDDNAVRVYQGYDLVVDGALRTRDLSQSDPQVEFYNGDHDLAINALSKEGLTTISLATTLSDPKVSVGNGSPHSVLSSTGITLYDSSGTPWFSADSNTKQVIPTSNPITGLTSPQLTYATSATTIGTTPLAFITSGALNVSANLNVYSSGSPVFVVDGTIGAQKVSINGNVSGTAFEVITFPAGTSLTTNSGNRFPATTGNTSPPLYDEAYLSSWTTYGGGVIVSAQFRWSQGGYTYAQPVGLWNSYGFSDGNPALMWLGYITRSSGGSNEIQIQVPNKLAYTNNGFYNMVVQGTGSTSTLTLKGDVVIYTMRIV